MVVVAFVVVSAGLDVVFLAAVDPCGLELFSVLPGDLAVAVVITGGFNVFAAVVVVVSADFGVVLVPDGLDVVVVVVVFVTVVAPGGFEVVGGGRGDVSDDVEVVVCIAVSCGLEIVVVSVDLVVVVTTGGLDVDDLVPDGLDVIGVSGDLDAVVNDEVFGGLEVVAVVDVVVPGGLKVVFLLGGVDIIVVSGDLEAIVVVAGGLEVAFVVGGLAVVVVFGDLEVVVNVTGGLDVAFVVVVFPGG